MLSWLSLSRCDPEVSATQSRPSRGRFALHSLRRRRRPAAVPDQRVSQNSPSLLAAPPPPPPARPPCWTRSPYSTAAVVAPRSGSSPKGVRYAWSSLASRPADLRWMQQRTRSGRDPLPRPGQQHGRLVHPERHRVHPQEQRGPAHANRQARLASDGGARSFREVFAHVAAEGNTETAMFGRPLPPGSLADFDAEEARLHEASGRPADRRDGPGHAESERDIGRPVAGEDELTDQVLRREPLPRVATTYPLNDLHEHLGQLVACAGMNTIVPPWTRKG